MYKPADSGPSLQSSLPPDMIRIGLIQFIQFNNVMPCCHHVLKMLINECVCQNYLLVIKGLTIMTLCDRLCQIYSHPLSSINEPNSHIFVYHCYQNIPLPYLVLLNLAQREVGRLGVGEVQARDTEYNCHHSNHQHPYLPAGNMYCNNGNHHHHYLAVSNI